MPAPVRETIPTNLKPYTSHGVILTLRGPDEEAVGECPFCGRDRLYVNPASGVWSCKVCSAGSDKGGGNCYTFLRILWERSIQATTQQDLEELCHDRRFLRTSTPQDWGVCRSVLTREWLVPGFNHEGKLTQLYRWVHMGDKRRLLCTGGLDHALHGANMWDPRKPKTALVEGAWDALALYETMRVSKPSGNGTVFDPNHLALTGSPEHSLHAQYNIVAPGGANVFKESWANLLGGTRVQQFFDNDHPKVQAETGKFLPPVGYEGMKRVTVVLAKAEEQPSTVEYVHWGDGDGNGTTGWCPNTPNGYDVRDYLSDAPNPPAGASERVGRLDLLLGKLKPVPAEWVPGRSGSSPGKSVGSVQMDVLPCDDWQDLVNAWRVAMKWTDGLDRGLSAVLACVTSTGFPGSQLWLKFIGPPGTGKTTIAEAVSANKRHVIAKSTIRGFHSGYRETADAKEDNSLLSQLDGKTLITKDGDTLLQSTNLGQVLSEARDVYDGTSRSSYRNKASKDYEGMRTTWVLCGTESLRALDSSELGERFLDCVIMKEIDPDEEEEVLLRVIHRADRHLSVGGGTGVKAINDEDMVKAMQLTAGYVDYLKDHTPTLLTKVNMADSELKACAKFAQFVAFMRSRPSKTQNEAASREAPYRLAEQLIRFAKCTAVVLQRTHMDQEVERRTRQIALDTARGVTMEMCQATERYQKQQGKPGWYMGMPGWGIDPMTLSMYINRSEDETKKLLRFLRKIGVYETYEYQPGPGLKAKVRWRLTERFAKLYYHVMRDEA